MKIGYVRVSSVGQKVDRQLDGIELEKIYTDHVSAATTKRPGLKDCLDFVREGDELHVHSIDRLARNLGDLKKLVDNLTDRGVTVIFHKENLRFTGSNAPIDKMILGVLGSIYEFERAVISERQMEGLQKRKKSGKKLGPEFRLNDDQISDIFEKLKKRQSISEICKEYSIHRTTMYRALNRKGFHVKYKTYLNNDELKD